ncbi:MAG: nucleotidyltransferase domain-containing protein [bacterium]|nr:nucleotidyltransferase domain-containing protein [bacterium]
MTCLPGDVVALGRRLQLVFRGYPTIAAVYLFGSVSRGTDSAESDVDLGLLLDQDGPGVELHRFLGDLAARLEALTAPRPIDLVVLNVQGAVFCHEVILEGHLVYEGNRERRIDFESDTIVRALDFRPTLEIATRGYLPGFRRWLRSYRDRQRHTAPT